MKLKLGSGKSASSLSRPRLRGLRTGAARTAPDRPTRVWSLLLPPDRRGR